MFYLWILKSKMFKTNSLTAESITLLLVLFHFNLQFYSNKVGKEIAFYCELWNKNTRSKSCIVIVSNDNMSHNKLYCNDLSYYLLFWIPKKFRELRFKRLQFFEVNIFQGLGPLMSAAHSIIWNVSCSTQLFQQSKKVCGEGGGKIVEIVNNNNNIAKSCRKLCCTFLQLVNIFWELLIRKKLVK
jgi:hypothetical protein